MKNNNSKRWIKILLLFLLITLISITFINIKNNIAAKKNQIQFLEKNLENKKSQIKNIHSKLLQKNLNLENILFDNGINFFKNGSRQIKINNEKYELVEFKSDDIIFAKHPEASSSAYIHLNDDDIYLMTATGQLVHTKYNDFKNEAFKMNVINTNIQNLIQYSEFYSSTAFGIKDFLVSKRNQIFVSYIKKHYVDCYSTSILKGTLNKEYIEFKEFYSPKKCINKNESFYDGNEYDHMVIHQSGGRMFEDNNILYFSTGEFRYRILAQDINSDYGKLLSINLLTNDKLIISMGHRNPQGLFIDKSSRNLLSTEHGPNGGDEINILKLDIKSSDTPNYGWPISSYGRHYYDDNDDKDSRYELSPLYKSHKKHGFIEPIKFFDPSVGISQITKINNNFYKSNQNSFVVGTMGSAKKIKEGMLSLYFFSLKDDKVINEQLIPIGSRVRDLAFNDKENNLVLYLETNNSLAILKKIN